MPSAAVTWPRRQLEAVRTGLTLVPEPIHPGVAVRLGSDTPASCSVLCALWFGLGPDFTSVLLSVPLTVVIVPGGARPLRNPVWREFTRLRPGCDQK